MGKNLTRKHKHYVTEHIWRALRATLLLLAVTIWLSQDGFQKLDLIILGLCITAHLTEQFHGIICNFIERCLGWAEDFNPWN